MIRNCCNCNSKISFWELYKQSMKNRNIYKCTECKAVHKATTFSLILFTIIYIAPLIYLIGKQRYLLLTLAWIFFSFFVLQPIIIQYKEKK